MKLTGERPMEGATPDSLLALHDAGYREVAARLGPGIVLDVGCGVGDETARLAGPDRLVVGVDYSRADRDRRRPRVGARRGHCAFAAMDGAPLGCRDRLDRLGRARRTSSSTSWHPSSTSPSSRASRPPTAPRSSSRRTAPADFENPFHVYLFEADELESLLALFFDDVTCIGLEGDDELHADFAAAPRERRDAC